MRGGKERVSHRRKRPNQTFPHLRTGIFFIHLSINLRSIIALSGIKTNDILGNLKNSQGSLVPKVLVLKVLVVTVYVLMLSSPFSLTANGFQKKVWGFKKQISSPFFGNAISIRIPSKIFFQYMLFFSFFFNNQSAGFFFFVYLVQYTLKHTFPWQFSITQYIFSCDCLLVGLALSVRRWLSCSMICVRGCTTG